MLFKIIQVSKKENIDKIIFKYLKTSKNKPCFDFLKSNLVEIKKNTFVHKINTKFNSPKFLKIL